MADRVGTIRFLTMAPASMSAPAIADDSVPDREVLDWFRAVGIVQEPNRLVQEPNRQQLETFRAVGDGQEPNRDEHRNRRTIDPAPDADHEPDGEPDGDPDGDSESRLAAPALETRLLDNVWRIAQSATRHTEGVMQWTYEYSLAQVLVLRAIVAAEAAGRPAMSITDVAHELQCSRANASELVAALVRQRSLGKGRDPVNRRIVRLYPTPDGRIAEYRARTLVAECACQVFTTLEGAEKQTLLTLLEKVNFM